MAAIFERLARAAQGDQPGRLTRGVRLALALGVLEAVGEEEGLGDGVGLGVGLGDGSGKAKVGEGEAAGEADGEGLVPGVGDAPGEGVGVGVGEGVGVGGGGMMLTHLCKGLPAPPISFTSASQRALILSRSGGAKLESAVFGKMT